MTHKRLLIAGLLIIALTIPSVLWWVDERNEEHARWQTLWNATVLLRFHTGAISDIIRTGNLSLPSTYERANTEWYHATWAMANLKQLDWDHISHLSKVESLLTYSNYSMKNLTLSERATLADLLITVFGKVGDAYSNYLDHTWTNTIYGPPFWYSGPAPPDENLLREAADLAYQRPGLPPFPF